MKMPPTGYMVYLLIDPRDMLPFYAGMTCRPSQRWGGHNGDRASAAFWRLQQLRKLGLKCRVRLVAIGLTLEEARAREREVIRIHRDVLLNYLLHRPARLRRYRKVAA